MTFATVWKRLWEALLGRATSQPAAVSRGVSGDANEAAAYGVQVTSATPAAGASYWKAVRVRHLAPHENNGRQNLYVNINDEAGARIYGAQARIGWSGGFQVVTVDKPTSEPGTNLPMWPGQVCDVIALGVPGLELASDKVTGLHTDHPDEATGNTRFHHSFEVTFQRVTAAVPMPVNASGVQGRVTNGAGRSIVLQREGATVATTVLAADGSFSFSALAAGVYRLSVAGTAVTSADIVLDGQNSVTVNLAVPETPAPAPANVSVVQGRVTNGAGRSIVLLCEGATVATTALAADDSFAFRALAAGLYQVSVAGTAVTSAEILLDGQNSVTVNLAVPEMPAPAEKPLPHYVLLAPVNTPAGRVNWQLAVAYVQTFGLTVGFDKAQARQAARVTLIGSGAEAIPAAVAQELEAAGCQVARIDGDSYAIEAELARRIAAGQA